MISIFTPSPPNSVRKCRPRNWEKKETVRCLFCGGSRCKRCGPDAYFYCTTPALSKVHSNWITDDIIAMQRPSDELIQNSNLIQQFNNNGITAIFNLTEPGEHPFCGSGNENSSGFPYSPEKFMASGVKHFNFSWRDMTVPSSDLMLDLCRVALSELNAKGKIAVHCHAGFGRTGIAIAAIMLFRDKNTNANNIISHIRMKRPGSIQTPAQEQFVIAFEKTLQRISCHYPISSTPTTNSAEPPYLKTISQSILDQYYTLHVQELEKLKINSKIVLITINSMISNMNQTILNAKLVNNNNNDDNNEYGNNNNQYPSNNHRREGEKKKYSESQIEFTIKSAAFIRFCNILSGIQPIPLEQSTTVSQASPKSHNDSLHPHTRFLSSLTTTPTAENRRLLFYYDTYHNDNNNNNNNNDTTTSNNEFHTLINTFKSTANQNNWGLWDSYFSYKSINYTTATTGMTTSETCPNISSRPPHIRTTLSTSSLPSSTIAPSLGVSPIIATSINKPFSQLPPIRFTKSAHDADDGIHTDSGIPNIRRLLRVTSKKKCEEIDIDENKDSPAILLPSANLTSTLIEDFVRPMSSDSSDENLSYVSRVSPRTSRRNSRIQSSTFRMQRHGIDNDDDNELEYNADLLLTNTRMIEGIQKNNDKLSQNNSINRAVSSDNKYSNNNNNNNNKSKSSLGSKSDSTCHPVKLGRGNNSGASSTTTSTNLVNVDHRRLLRQDLEVLSFSEKSNIDEVVEDEGKQPPNTMTEPDCGQENRELSATTSIASCGVKVASQLLFDWLLSRADPIFDPLTTHQLLYLWKQHHHHHTASSLQSNHTTINYDHVASRNSSSTVPPIQIQHTKSEDFYTAENSCNDTINQYNNTTAAIEKEISKHSNDNIFTINHISNILHQNMNRYTLNVLSHIVRLLHDIELVMSSLFTTTTRRPLEMMTTIEDRMVDEAVWLVTVKLALISMHSTKFYSDQFSSENHFMSLLVELRTKHFANIATATANGSIINNNKTTDKLPFFTSLDHPTSSISTPTTSSDVLLGAGNNDGKGSNVFTTSVQSKNYSTNHIIPKTKATSTTISIDKTKTPKNNASISLPEISTVLSTTSKGNQDELIENILMLVDVFKILAVHEWTPTLRNSKRLSIQRSWTVDTKENNFLRLFNNVPNILPR